MGTCWAPICENSIAEGCKHNPKGSRNRNETPRYYLDCKTSYNFSDLGVSFWRGLNGEDGNLQHLYLAPYVVEALWLWHYAALGMELCWLPVSRERDSISQKSAATRWVFYSR